MSLTKWRESTSYLKKKLNNYVDKDKILIKGLWWDIVLSCISSENA